ncbi:glycerate kinase [Bacillus sp. B-jedd]|uniref:glycerate kinase n=1 Tax=Bacillus sp. B-jedd TaxID=1476857 RepID=UPI0005155A5F|nr:glycerate kinase [Bacillus sp. B-jedd]CEG28672.1 glycerate kinase [Bacillus sp. B-jedd]
MKIVIAPDSFKGSMSSVEAAKAIRAGILRVYPDAETVELPVADGGEGTLETLIAATNGIVVPVNVRGPLGTVVKGEYGVLGDRKTCVIEMAKASGLSLVSVTELDPLKATTYGTGQMIKQALDDGYKSFILALGGSATNDGGAGMLQALGIKLLDGDGVEVGHGGAEVIRVSSIDLSGFDSRIKDCEFLIASDVQNPFTGPEGASYVFGPQKGATQADVEHLDQCLSNFADVIKRTTGVQLHDMPGAGAAGGIGGAFLAFFPARMKRGIDVVIEYTKLSEKLEGAELVITGEGRVDFQTASGKTPMGVAQAAARQGIPTIILAGAVGTGIEGLYENGVVSIHSIITRPLELHEAIESARELTEFASEQVVRSFFYRS